MNFFAFQLLPLEEESAFFYSIIKQAIEIIKKYSIDYVVCPMETIFYCSDENFFNIYLEISNLVKTYNIKAQLNAKILLNPAKIPDLNVFRNMYTNS